MNNIMASSVRLLEDIKPSVSVDKLLGRKESMLTNKYPQYDVAVELPRATSPSGEVFFLGPNDSGGVETAHSAYQEPRNYCVSTIDKKHNSFTASGKICIPNNPSLVRCKGVLAPLHFLVVIAPEKDSTDKESDEASSDTLAYSIIPKILYESVREMMDKKYAIFVNALPKQYFEENTIPNSISIPVKEHEKLSGEERKEKFNKIIQRKQLEYPHMMDLEVEEVPLVVFCAHEKCNASEKLCELLREAGFKKIFEYTGGQKDYDEKSGKTLEDSSSDEDSDEEESDLDDDEDNKDTEDEEDEKDEANKDDEKDEGNKDEKEDKDEENKEEKENDFNKLTDEGVKWVKEASEDMRKRVKENNNKESSDEEKNNNEDLDEESSEEEPENDLRGGAKRKNRKRRRKARRVLRGGSWCFDLSFLL